MSVKVPMEESAREYLRGGIAISTVSRFTRPENSPMESYHTTKGAFIFPISGQCRISFDEESFLATEGTLIHGCPGKTLQFQVLGSQPFTYINLYYETEQQYVFQYEMRNKSYIWGLLEQLGQLSTRKDLSSAMEKNHVISLLFDQIYEDYITPEARSNRELAYQSAIYIREHCTMNMTLEFLAETFGKTVNQFSYLFYTYMNARPIQYLIFCRLSKACDYLTESNMPIYEVAKKVGYEDPLFFSRLFKKHIGRSPRQFRAVYSQDTVRLFSSQDRAVL